MIQARDLCIGNWVYDGERTQFPMFIRAVGEDYVYLDFPQNEGDLWESKPEDLQGIPITEELLKGLGMTLSNGLWRHKLGVKVKLESGFVFIENKDSENWLYGNATCKDIWYLHQLQNLVRIITKQELKINL